MQCRVFYAIKAFLKPWNEIFKNLCLFWRNLKSINSSMNMSLLIDKYLKRITQFNRKLVDYTSVYKTVRGVNYVKQSACDNSMINNNLFASCFSFYSINILCLIWAHSKSLQNLLGQYLLEFGNSSQYWVSLDQNARNYWSKS